MRLASSFKNHTSIRQDYPLTNEQIMSVAPSIFAENAHESRSNRYTYIPTIAVIEGLRKEGFFPFMVAQSRTLDESRQDFTKHMLRLRRAENINDPEAYEIVLLNSHDGTSSYQMLVGLFRFVCQNGMVSGDTTNDIRVLHRGNIVENVIEAAYTVSNSFDNVKESVESMKSTLLLPGESEVFAKAALALKYDENKAPIPASRLLQRNRYEDSGSDLWTAFNKVQENLVNGGQRGITADNRRTTTRPVKAIDSNVKLNRALWILAEEMAAMKRSA